MIPIGSIFYLLNIQMMIDPMLCIRHQLLQLFDHFILVIVRQ